MKKLEFKEYFTENSFHQAVEMYKTEGHRFLGYTYQGAIFADLVLIRKW